MDDIMPPAVAPKEEIEIPRFTAIPSEGWVYHYLKNYTDTVDTSARREIAISALMDSVTNSRSHGHSGILQKIIGIDNIDKHQMSAQPKRYRQNDEDDSKLDYEDLWERIVKITEAGKEYHKDIKNNYATVRNLESLKDILGLTEPESELLKLVFVLQETDLAGIVQSVTKYTGSLEQSLSMMMGTNRNILGSRTASMPTEESMP